MFKDAMVNGSAVLELALLFPQEYEMGKWYRSKEIKDGDNPFASYMLNKKWSLEEEFNIHLLRFQQVRVSFIYFRKLFVDFVG